jgi:methyl-accepting chemotaxis protein
MEENGGDEAMNRIAVDFNGMVTELEQTTSHLKSYVEEVEGAGIGIERSADTVGGASDNVIDSMEKIAGDAGSQRAQLAEVSESLDDVAAALERVATDHPDAELEPQIDRLEANAATLRDVAGTSETIQSETKVVSAAVAELAAELNEVSSRAADLQRYANPLQAMLDRFETDSENESLISEATAGE